MPASIGWPTPRGRVRTRPRARTLPRPLERQVQVTCAAVTASLPLEVQQVFDSFLTTEFTTVDSRGRPICWPLTPYYRPGDPCIDVTTALGYPKKAEDARGNPKVSLLFSDPTGSGMDDAPQVLVQGTADVDARDLEANRVRYTRESLEKLPGSKDMLPPKPLQRVFSFYFTRLYIHVRPERVYVWPGAEPVWDERMDELGGRYPSAALSLVAPDGFPFSVRVPISVDSTNRRIRLGGDVLGVPVQPGLACVTVHDHAPDFSWQRNFQVRGDLVEEDGGWVLVPHRMVGGLELPPVSKLQLYRTNARKMARFWRTANKTRRELSA